MTKTRKQLLEALWRLQDEAYDLMTEYDGIPHLYGDDVMYHTEGQIIDLIAQNPEITCTEIAVITKKTPSACSQLVKKLRKGEYVEQIRNEQNNRIYNLLLTEKGQNVYEQRKVFNKNCQKIMEQMLEVFTAEELEHHVKVQQMINEAYQGDINRSRENIK